MKRRLSQIGDIHFIGYISIVGAVFMAILPVPSIIAFILLIMGVICFMTASREMKRLYIMADEHNKKVVEAKEAKRARGANAVKVANLYYNMWQREEEQNFWRSHKA